MVNLGDDAPVAVASLAKLEAMLAANLANTKIGAATFGDVPFRRLASSPEEPFLLWGFKGNLFLAAVGDKEAKALIERLAKPGKPAAWLQDIHKQLAVDAPATTLYFNAALAYTRAMPQVTDPTAKSVVDALGLSHLKTFAGVSGLSATGSISRSRVWTDGKPVALLSLLSTRPVVLADLKIVPREAVMAAAGRIDLPETYGNLLKLAAQIDDPNAKALPDLITSFEKQLDLRLVDDMLKPLGNSWTVFNSVNSLPMTGTPWAGVAYDGQHCRSPSSCRPTSDLLVCGRRLTKGSGSTRRPAATGPKFSPRSRRPPACRRSPGQLRTPT